MKTTILSVAALCGAMLVAVPVLAGPSADKTAQTKVDAPDVVAFDKQMSEAQARMKAMREQMNALHQTQDPQQRQKLLQGHWATMQDAMTSMDGMWAACAMGEGMMGGDMMDGHMMDGGMMGWSQMGDRYSKLTPEQMKQHQYMMDRYTGMQQMMMNQMMQHHKELMQPAKP